MKSVLKNSNWYNSEKHLLERPRRQRKWSNRDKKKSRELEKTPLLKLQIFWLLSILDKEELNLIQLSVQELLDYLILLTLFLLEVAQQRLLKLKLSLDNGHHMLLDLMLSYQVKKPPMQLLLKVSNNYYQVTPYQHKFQKLHQLLKLPQLRNHQRLRRHQNHCQRSTS